MESESNALDVVMAELAAIKAKLDEPIGSKVENPMTVSQLVDYAISTCKASSLRTYRSGWMALVTGFGEKDTKGYVEGIGSELAHKVTTEQLNAFLEPIRERAKAHNKHLDLARFDAGRAQRASNGETAVYNAVGAWRKLFEIAAGMDAMGSAANPARKVKKPGRAMAQRTWLTDDQIRQVVSLAGSTGDDPELDVLLCRFHLITGARQEGALNLRVHHVDVAGCMVRLDEKRDKVTWQPVPDWFAKELVDFAFSRGQSSAEDPVFVKRTRSGAFKAISPRRYNYLFERLQVLCEWMDRQQVTAHTLRHCAGKLVERHAGVMVAQGFLRHSVSTVTGRYTVASPKEVAQAVIDLWGGSHPYVEEADSVFRVG